MPRPKGDYVYTDEQLLDYLKKYYEVHGRIPRYRDFDMDPTIPSAVIVSKRFGNWNRALKKAGFTPNRVSYSKAYLLRQLNEFYEVHGRIPTVDDFRENDELPSVRTYYRKFGSWTNALKETGLERENDSKTSAENLSPILQKYYYSGKYSPNSLVVNIAILVDFETFLIEKQNKKGFPELELRDVIEYFNHLEEIGVYNAKRKVDQKPNSINTLIGKAIVIAGFLSWDEKISYKPNHPIIPIGVNKEIKEFLRKNYSSKHGKETIRRALSQEQTKMIFRKLRHPILRFIVWLGLNFALRRAEYLRLKIDHINLVDKKIKIYGKYKGGRPKERISDLTDEQVKRLKQEIKRRNLFRANHDYLITTHQGNKPYISFIGSCYRKISKIVGFKVTSHDIRYTAAKRWEKATSDDGTKFLLSDIQKMLGHANLMVTSLYLRTGKEELKERYNKVLNDNKNEYW